MLLSVVPPDAVGVLEEKADSVPPDADAVDDAAPEVVADTEGEAVPEGKAVIE